MVRHEDDPLNDSVKLAWVAGFLEGEGCFYARESAVKKDGTVRYYPSVSVNLCDVDVLYRLKEWSGIGTVYVSGPPPAHGRHRQVHRWQSHVAGDVLKLVEAIRPFLCERREGQVAAMLEQLTKTEPRKRKDRTDDGE